MESNQNGLPGLPRDIIIRIAEHLPMKDLPNLISCCKTLASMAHDLYQERQVVDMSCFETVTPGLCNHLIDRFQVARLHKLCFRYDVRRQHSYDLETLDAIVAHFLDNVNPSNSHFQRDLRNGNPRMLDILAHCYFLDRFLSRHPQLRALDVDRELSVFKVPSSQGRRMDWHLLNPFLTLDAVRRHCALLESYSTHPSLDQMDQVDLPHVQMRFLDMCPKLKVVSFVLVAGTEELGTYERMRRQLALEKAEFYLPGWQVPPEQCRLNAVRLRNLGARLDGLKKAKVCFRRRVCLPDCRDLITALPRIESLYFCCDFNPNFPVYDIDEAGGCYFGDAFSLLSGAAPTLSRIVLMGVPEDEFELLFEGVLPVGIREINVQLHWRSPDLDETREGLLDRFLENARRLEIYYIAGVRPSQQTQLPPVFYKAKNWRRRCNW